MKIPGFLTRKKPPEHSLAFRAATLCSVLIGILATLHEEMWPTFGWVVVALTAFGFWLSYRRREHTNWVIKIFLSFGMIWAAYGFFTELIENPFDPRVPLANLLLWLQTLHSFDLPARRDLNYSLVTGFILVSVAAVLSHDMTYVAFLASFLICALLTMHYNYLSSAADGARVVNAVPRFRKLAGRTIAMGAGLLVVSAVAFLFIPRYESMRIKPMPMTFHANWNHAAGKGQITNPAYPRMNGGLGGAAHHFDPDNYFGFNSELDLNLRGKLSDDVVMRVRSSEWSYYRGLAFNHYSGAGWTMTDENLQKLVSATPPIWIDGAPPGNHDIVQIFYIEKDMPNVVFAAFHAQQLFFVSDTVYIDAHSGLRAPYPLEAGTVYSTVSSFRQPNYKVLKGIAHHFAGRRSAYFPGIMELNGQLPSTVPKRVADLAHQLTDKRPDSFAKAAAIALYLQQNYQYTLDIPPFAEGTDAADEFLFHYKKGYCEQFATAMAVLCREVGLPARLVTGFAPGTYNPFTGYYEVKGSDAHAWVEVFVDGFGWVQFDPTPGVQAIPQLQKPERSSWVMGTLVAYAREHMGEGAVHMIEHIAETGNAIQNGMRRLFGGAAPVAWLVVLGGLVALGLGVDWLWNQIRSRRRRRGSLTAAAPRKPLAQRLAERLRAMLTRAPAVEPVAADPRRGEVKAVYARMLDELYKHGCERRPSQTPAEFAGRASEALPSAREPIQRLTAQYQVARYSAHELEQEAVEAARATLKDFLDQAKARREIK
jgi:hypothetical protein